MGTNNAYPPETRYSDCGLKLYSKWRKSVKDDCDPAFKNYLVFYDWALSSGYQPGMRLVKLNPYEPYSPENCVWEWMRSPLIIPGGEDGKQEFCNRWNKTVNVFRRHYGLRPFPIEGMNNVLKKEEV